MATVVGIAFILVLLIAPQRGLLATARRQRRQRWTFARQMLLIHLATHEGTPIRGRRKPTRPHATPHALAPRHSPTE